MRLLVLGGTVFLGRHIVSAALARGHQVVMFNRGRHNGTLFPEVERVVGDRNGDVSALRGRSFDAVVDTSGYTPAHVHAVLDVLLPAVPHYTFISSISVYSTFPPHRRFDETAPVASGEDGYGPLKARAEEVVVAALPARAAIVRPGLIVGPHDPTDRFTYWPRRVSQGGAVLAPGRDARPVQFIDVRDLAEWCVRLAEHRRSGTFNAIGPDPLTMGGLLDACRTVARTDARFVWVPDGELLEAGVSPWTELPLWIPEDSLEFGGMLLADNSRAVSAGLVFRPVADTVRATLDWDRAEGASLPPSPIRVTPMTRERETELLGRHGAGAAVASS